MGILNSGKKEIRRVKLLGVREAHETLMFHTVNFSLYSFWVEYTDGSTATIECSPESPTGNKRKQKQLFDKLMSIANAKPRVQESVSRNTDVSIMDELQKLNDLHESGVIPDGLFEEKKTVLLEKLSGFVIAERESPNLFITRTKERPIGEGKTVLLVDGVEASVDLDKPASLFLDSGEHFLKFKRAAVTSPEIHLFASKSKKYEILLSPKIFSIDAELREIR